MKKSEQEERIINEKKDGDKMKEKILLFAIGVLVGGLIATGVFFACIKASSCSNVNENSQIKDTIKREKPSKQPNNQSDTNKHQGKSKSNTNEKESDKATDTTKESN